MCSPIKKRIRQKPKPPSAEQDKPIQTVIVDSRSLAVFEVPLDALRRNSSEHFRAHFHRPRKFTHISLDHIAALLDQRKRQSPGPEEIFFPCMTVSAFADFIRWLETGRILPFHHYNAQYAIEANARRLVTAIEIGAFLKSTPYQTAAAMELHVLGRKVMYPADLAESIFRATESGNPARKLIVEIVAAKMCSGTEGRPYIRVGDKDQTGITNIEFWSAFDSHCRKSEGRCVYPLTV